VNSVSWEFPWLEPGADVDHESAKVTRQGAWVLSAEIMNSGLGFAFWALAARLFSTRDVGIAAALVSLSSLATSIAILGLDNGLMRFATKVSRPRRFIRQLVAITGALGVVVGFVLALSVLTLSGVDPGSVSLLIVVGVVLTVSQIWFQITDSAILAAGKARILAYRALAYGAVKIVLIFAIVSAGAPGLFAAYTLPLLVIVVASFLILPRLWPSKNDLGSPHKFKEVATLSAGNWISGFAYSLPNRIGPSLILIFLGNQLGPPTVAFFFITLQLAEVLNYVSESIAKSLFAHGSREDRLTPDLTSSMRGLLVLILVPLVVVGIVGSPFALSVVGGDKYSVHSLSLQLFLLATLPKSFYQVLKAQFNVQRRPIALIVSGGTLGLSTLAFLVIGLVLQVNPDLLPVSWILGGVLALGVSQYLAGWKPRFRAPRADAG